MESLDSSAGFEKSGFSNGQCRRPGKPASRVDTLTRNKVTSQRAISRPRLIHLAVFLAHILPLPRLRIVLLLHTASRVVAHLLLLLRVGACAAHICHRDLLYVLAGTTKRNRVALGSPESDAPSTKRQHRNKPAYEPNSGEGQPSSSEYEEDGQCPASKKAPSRKTDKDEAKFLHCATLIILRL